MMKGEGDLDWETKGMISEIINHAFEKRHFLEAINWLLEADDQVRSQEDLALGYFMGYLMETADSLAWRMKRHEKTEKLRRKRLEENWGKEEAAKYLKEQERAVEELRAKGGRPMKVELTEEETESIRSMLIPMIASFREKIRKEIALSRV